MSPELPPEGVEMPSGGVGYAEGWSEPIQCDRCPELATRNWEGSGVNFLQLCPDCYRALGEWLSESA